jgi:hypothetical protein
MGYLLPVCRRFCLGLSVLLAIVRENKPGIAMNYVLARFYQTLNLKLSRFCSFLQQDIYFIFSRSTYGLGIASQLRSNREGG